MAGTSKTKKTTQKIKEKKSTGKPRKKQGTVKEVLIKELKTLIKDIDEEGLKFLVSQAHVLSHNLKVENLNAEIAKASSSKSKRRTFKKPPYSDKESMEIVEANDNSSFIFVINRERKFIALDEMRKIVKICHVSKDEKNAAQRMYNWFKNNRGDILIDVGIDGSKDQALKTIYNYIIKRYTVKD